MKLQGGFLTFMPETSRIGRLSLLHPGTVSGFLFMSVTILETLQNAKINLIENGNLGFGVRLGTEQVKNAVTLLEKGYSLDEEVDPLLDKYGSVYNVPVKQ